MNTERTGPGTLDNTDPEATGNYYYSPPISEQVGALKTASIQSRTNIIQKTLGVLNLDTETKAELAKGRLTLIATIPNRGVMLKPHP